jgi:hypothetical protein
MVIEAVLPFATSVRHHFGPRENTRLPAVSEWTAALPEIIVGGVA